MHILVLGAAGMVGRKLVERLLRDGRLGKADITQNDAAGRGGAGQAGEAGISGRGHAGDFAVPGAAEKLIAGRPDVIFHLAAIVSGEAELDFDKGYRINLDGTRMLIDAIRAGRRRLQAARWCSRPRSRCSARRSPTRSATSSSTRRCSSYGTQKAIGELLIADYSRRGFLDGIGIRLPTICIRPGAPNKAASGFFSNILREPLAGKEAVLPVSEDVRHWHATPRSAVGFLLHAATMDLATVGPRRSLTMPGLSATVGEQIAALEARRGREGRRAHQARAGSLHHGHRRRLAAQFRGRSARAQLGFTTAEKTFDDIIRIHIEDELGGKFVEPES